MAQAIKQAKPGDRVKINFNGKLEDGTLFDSTYENHASEHETCEDDGCGCSSEGGPMELEIGSSEFFPQIEEALIGMSPGDQKTLTISAADAFGEYDVEKVSMIPRSQFPAEIKPAVGDDLELVNDDDEGLVVSVIEVSDVDVTLDANHPLAGENLCFEVEMVEIL